MNSSSTLFHEFFHANDYYSGVDKFVTKNFSYPENILFLGHGAYRFENHLFNTPVGRQNLHNYFQSYFEFLLR